jgi:hypothetical protein
MVVRGKMPKPNPVLSIKLLDDQPIHLEKDDIFGYKTYKNLLEKAILGTDEPITLGIFGGWGTGKTSLMKMLFESLRENSGIIPVWFDAWRYQNEPNLLIPLLFAIRDSSKDYLERYKKTPLRKKVGSFVDFMESFLFALASGLEVGIDVNGLSARFNAKDALEAAKKISQSKEQVKSNIGVSLHYDIFTYLHKKVEEILKEGVQKYIIFIDDLDRCSAEKALSLLETIQLVLNMKGFVYIIGVDRNVIENVVKSKYPGEIGIDKASFLKKIFQVFFTLPPLKSDDLSIFIGRLLEAEIKNRKELAAVCKIIENSAGSNPREIKRLVNNFGLVRNLVSGKILPSKIALILVIQQKWPIIFDVIEAYKSDFIKLCEIVNTNREKILRGQSIGKKFKTNAKIVSELFFEPTFLKFLALNCEGIIFNETDLEDFFYFTSNPLFISQIKFLCNVEKTGNLDVPYSWTISLVALPSILQRIGKVIYQLPPSRYENSTRITTINDGFSITDVSRTNVNLTIKVMLTDGEILEYPYFIDVSKTSES